MSKDDLIQQEPVAISDDMHLAYVAGYHKGKAEGKLAAILADQSAQVGEVAAYIQRDHLQKAMQAPFLCRVEPTQRSADFEPIYTSPPITSSQMFEKKDAGEKSVLVDLLREVLIPLSISKMDAMTSGEDYDYIMIGDLEKKIKSAIASAQQGGNK